MDSNAWISAFLRRFFHFSFSPTSILVFACLLFFFKQKTALEIRLSFGGLGIAIRVVVGTGNSGSGGELDVCWR